MGVLLPPELRTNIYVSRDFVGQIYKPLPVYPGSRSALAAIGFTLWTCGSRRSLPVRP